MWDWESIIKHGTFLHFSKGIFYENKKQNDSYLLSMFNAHAF